MVVTEDLCGGLQGSRAWHKMHVKTSGFTHAAEYRCSSRAWPWSMVKPWAMSLTYNSFALALIQTQNNSIVPSMLASIFLNFLHSKSLLTYPQKNLISLHQSSVSSLTLILSISYFLIPNECLSQHFVLFQRCLPSSPNLLMCLLKGHLLINSPVYLLVFITYWPFTCGKMKSLLPETHQAQDTCQCYHLSSKFIKVHFFTI